MKDVEQDIHSACLENHFRIKKLEQVSAVANCSEGSRGVPEKEFKQANVFSCDIWRETFAEEFSTSESFTINTVLTSTI